MKCVLWIIIVFLSLVWGTNGLDNNESCQSDPCHVMSLLERETEKNDQFRTEFTSFLSENNLLQGHETMKMLMVKLGSDVRIDSSSSLLTYVIMYQKFLQDEMKRLNTKAEDDLGMIVEDIALYVSQIMTDFEKLVMKEITEQNRTITETINDAETRITQNIESHMNNITSRILATENRIMDKLDNVIMNDVNANGPCANVKKNFRPTDCMDIRLCADEKKNGVYTIYPLLGCDFISGIKVYCDMETDGGGWTVFLSRQRRSIQENFDRPWADYRDGFGNPYAEYWLGNEALYLMTTAKDYAMRVDVMGPGTPRIIWGEWSYFKVESQALNYLLNLDGYDVNSTMVDSFTHVSNKQPFSTFDRDNDDWYGNCAKKWIGGFWYKECYYHNPTGPYKKIQFRPWSASDQVPRYAIKVQMKIRPNESSP